MSKKQKEEVKLILSFPNFTLGNQLIIQLICLLSCLDLLLWHWTKRKKPSEQTNYKFNCVSVICRGCSVIRHYKLSCQPQPMRPYAGCHVQKNDDHRADPPWRTPLIQCSLLPSSASVPQFLRHSPDLNTVSFSARTALLLRLFL